MSKVLVPLIAAAAYAVSSAAFAGEGCSGALQSVSTPQPVTTADSATTPIVVPTQPSG
jgi:hypothetical protein